MPAAIPRHNPAAHAGKNALLEMLADSDVEGLASDDYHIAALRRLPSSITDLAALEARAAIARPSTL